MRDIPLFIIGGFLDSGKTSFIIETISQDEFYKKGRTLLVAFEDGEIEYHPDFLKKFNIDIVRFEDQEDYDVSIIDAAINKYNSLRVIVEMNDMWDLDKIRFPEYCQLMQEAFFVNYETFNLYFTNMKQKFVDLIRQADLVVFNRCDNIEELRKFQTNIKMINNQCRYIAIDSDGNVQEAFLQELPYDLDADIIDIKDDDYGIFYMDTFDNKDSYADKTVRFNCLVVKSDKLPKNCFIAGRLAMTCCQDDIQLFGHLCHNILNVELNDRDWINITAGISYQYSEEYDEEELLLTPFEIKIIQPIKNPILNFQ